MTSSNSENNPHAMNEQKKLESPAAMMDLPNIEDDTSPAMKEWVEVMASDVAPAAEESMATADAVHEVDSSVEYDADVDASEHSDTAAEDDEEEEEEDNTPIDPAHLAILDKVKTALALLATKLDSYQRRLEAQVARMVLTKWAPARARMTRVQLTASSERLAYDIGLVGEELFRHLCSLDQVQGTPAARPLRRAAVEAVKAQIERSDALREAIKRKSEWFAALPERRTAVPTPPVSPKGVKATAAAPAAPAMPAAPATPAAPAAPAAHAASKKIPKRAEPTFESRITPNRTGIEVVAHLPGVRRDDIRVVADDAQHRLVVTGPHFQREFETPAWVNADAVTAKFDDAHQVLTMFLPARPLRPRSPLPHTRAAPSMFAAPTMPRRTAVPAYGAFSDPWFGGRGSGFGSFW